MMRFPVIVVNFKAYREAVGPRGELLAQKICSVSKENSFSVAVAVQNADIFRISRLVKIPVFSQHIDPVGWGQYTGHDMPACIKENGAYGAIINHSERKACRKEIKESIACCKKYGLTSLVCAAKVRDVKEIAAMKPDMVAIEPPELIGTGIGVSTARPAIVKKSVGAAMRLPVLCGAGISKAEDVASAIALGCSGVLICSAIVRSKNPQQVLLSFIRAAKQLSAGE